MDKQEARSVPEPQNNQHATPEAAPARLVPPAVAKIEENIREKSREQPEARPGLHAFMTPPPSPPTMPPFERPQRVEEAQIQPIPAPTQATTVSAVSVQLPPPPRPPEQGAERVMLHAHAVLSGLEPIKSVSERSAPDLYDTSVPHILAFSNGIELIDPVCLATEVSAGAALPRWLTGFFYFLGPGLFDIEYVHRTKLNLACFTFKNWSDGLALIHRFAVDVGGPGAPGIVYRNRYASTDLQERARRYAQLYSIATDSEPNSWLLPHLYDNKWSPTPSDVNANMHLLLTGSGMTETSLEKKTQEIGQEGFDARLVSTGKFGIIQEIDPVTLLPRRVRSYYQINNAFKGLLAGVPIRDPDTKETFQVVMDPGHNATYTIFSIMDEDYFEPPGHVLCRIKARPSCAFHLAVTKSFLVLVVYPFSAGPMNWKLALSRSNLDSLKFDRESQTFFHVIDRHKRTNVATFTAPPCYARSILNATESNQSLYIDLNCYEDDLIEYCLLLRNVRKLGMPPFPDSTVRRYILSRVPDASGKKNPSASFSHRTDFALEFGSIGERSMGKQYRFAYGLSFTSDVVTQMNQIWNCISRADLDFKTRISWSQDGCFPGPPLCVSAPDGDHDVVVSVVLDSARERSFLLFLNAETMTEISRAWLPHSVPFYSSALFQSRPFSATSSQ